MATTINSRQLELDNSSTRTTISTTTLTAADTEFFLQESSGTVFPANIVISSTITAIVTPTYVWSYKNSTQTSYTVITGQTSSSLIVTNTAFINYLGTGTSVTFKLDVSQKGFVSSSATVNISYRKEADDVIQTVISNPNVLVLTNDQGTPTTLSNTGATLQVIQNGRYLPYSATANDSFRVGTPTISPASSVVLGATSSTTTSFSYSDISSITSDSVSVTYPIIIKNKAGTDRNTINVVQKYLKVKSAASGITVNLTNESHNIPTDSAGANPVYGSSGTSIYVYDGTTQLDYDGIGTASGKWTVSAVGTSINPGSVTDGGTYAVYGNASNITADTAFITYNITGKTTSGASFSLVKTQTFVKVKSGTNPIIYDIFTSSPIISKLSPDAATSGVHSSITIQGKRQEGSTTTNFGWVTVTPNGGTESATATDTSTTPVTLAPANGDGKTSYTIKLYNQATVSGAVLLDTQVVPVVFKGDTGAPGAPGTKYITVSCFNWLNTSLTVAPSATATYNWSNQSVTGFPATWSASAQSSPGSGYTLYRLDVVVSAAGDFTGNTSFNWNTASINIVGFRQDGSQGKGARVAFIVTTSNTIPVITSSTVSGDSLPVTTGGTWSTTATSNLSAGQYLYQVDGLYDPVTLTTTWGNPYLSNLKVGSLSAITVNTGQLTFDETGNIKSANNTGYDTTGVFLGYSTNNYKVSVVSGSNKLTFDGTDLTITGKINAGSFITGSVQLDNSSGTSLLTIASNASSALSGLTSKLDKQSAYILGTNASANQIALQTQNYVDTGGATGLVITSTGILGRKNNTTTFAIDNNGDATFAGSLSAATGTFAGSLSAVTGSFGSMTLASGGQINAGSFTGFGWPSVSGDGFHLGPQGLLFGSAVVNNSPFVQIGAAGYVAIGKVINSSAVPSFEFNPTTASLNIKGTLTAGSIIVNTVTLSSGTALSTIETYASNGNSALSQLSNKLDKQSAYILGTNASANQIALQTQNYVDTSGATGLVITNTGILGRKSGTTTFAIDNNGNATFAGTLSAATGTFAGSLSAATGTFAGSLSAATGSFSGTITASGGTIGAIEIYDTGSEKGIRSTNYSSTNGFAITNGGFAVFRNANIGGLLVSSSQVYSSNYNGTTGTGFQIANNGYAEFFNVKVKGEIAAGGLDVGTGNVRGGKTGYNDSTAGFFLGNSGGTYAFSIGTSSKNMKWDGSDLYVTGGVITGGSIASSVSITLPSFSASISSSSYTASTSINTTVSASRTATPSGGSSPYTYQWVVANEYKEPPGLSGGISISNATTSSVTISVRSNTNSNVSGDVVCYVTDSNNRTTTVACSVNITFGSGPP